MEVPISINFDHALRNVKVSVLVKKSFKDKQEKLLFLIFSYLSDTNLIFLQISFVQTTTFMCSAVALIYVAMAVTFSILDFLYR